MQHDQNQKPQNSLPVTLLTDSTQSHRFGIRNWAHFPRGTIHSHGLTNWLIVLSLLGAVYLNFNTLVEGIVVLSGELYEILRRL